VFQKTGRGGFIPEASTTFNTAMTNAHEHYVSLISAVALEKPARLFGPIWESVDRHKAPVSFARYIEDIFHKRMSYCVAPLARKDNL